MECGQGAYIDLMKQYPRVVAVFLGLEERYQKVRHTACGRVEFRFEEFLSAVMDI
jgi:hypothetical protein